MKKLIFRLTCAMCVIASGTSYAKGCPKHTHEQQTMIHLAHIIGAQEDLGMTLASIVIQESFVGPYIIRSNIKDGKYGSYGITHILLSTAMWLEGYNSVLRARQDLIPKLVGVDQYSMYLSLKKLSLHKNRGWQGMVKKYNGTGPMAEVYAVNVAKHLTMLRQCYTLEDM